MGVLLKALTPPSSYAAKGGKDKAGPDQWAELKDRIDGCILMSQLDAFVDWLDARPLEYPPAYREPLEELIEAKREEIQSEDIGQILRDRFDFT
jgi:hypothetical protein